jgi:four helix bundle protein
VALFDAARRAMLRSDSAFPPAETYGLTGQLRRTAVSIPSNVAEGHCRRSTKAYKFHVGIALGSHAELETCIDLALRLCLLSDEQHRALRPGVESTGKLLSRLYQALQRKAQSERPKYTETGR